MLSPHVYRQPLVSRAGRPQRYVQLDLRVPLGRLGFRVLSPRGSFVTGRYCPVPVVLRHGLCSIQLEPLFQLGRLAFRDAVAVRVFRRRPLLSRAIVHRVESDFRSQRVSTESRSLPPCYNVTFVAVLQL